ncbi:unnamed protein product [Rotaria magnacalcarata]|uniref:CCHC-type domain-containing protein n=4 Tax=Rotaria magnacalcarata TaxID=392030 RepID=A0A816FLB8_9BILA|nr:unnamed protein product [Rotaria magnacalcarata]
MLTRQDAKRLFEVEFQRLSDINITFADRTTVAPIVYRPTELIMAEKTVAILLSIKNHLNIFGRTSKLNHLYHGLKPSLMKDVLREAPSIPADFLEQARREENLDRLVTTSNHQTNDNDTQAINYSNNSLYRSTQSTEAIRHPNSSNMYSGGYPATGYSPRPVYNRFHHQSSPRYPWQAQQSSFNALHYKSCSLRCYLCNKLGHFARDCRSAKNY